MTLSGAAQDAAPASTASPDREALLAALRPELEALEAEARAHLARFKRRLMVRAPLAIVAFVVLGVVIPVVGVFIAFAGFVVLALYELHALMGFVVDARAQVAALIAPHAGFTHHDRLAEALDFGAFEGSSYGELLARGEAVNALVGARGGAAVEIFDARVKSPAKASRLGDAARMMAMVRVARVAIPGRWTARTIVLRDQGAANAFHARGDDMKRVRLVDPKFEDVFEVFSTDQVEARALLTPVFMERLQALEAQFADQQRAPVAAFADGAFMVALAAFGPERAAGGRREDVEIKAERLVDEVLGVLAMVDALTGAASAAGEVSESPADR